MKSAAEPAARESRSNAEQVSSKAIARFPAVIQRAAEKHVAVTVSKQQKHNWCWAAVCETFTGKTQEALAKLHTPGYKENGPGKREDPCDVLRKEGKNVDVTGGPPDWDEMVKTLDGNETPLCMVGKHYVIVCGYKGNGGNVKDRRYFYKDPADGDMEKECTEDELKTMEGGFLGWYLVF